MRRIAPYLLSDSHPFWLGQAKALVCIAGATAVRAALDPVIDTGLYFTFVFPSVFIAGFWGGNCAAITTAAGGGLIAGYIWIPPRYSFDLPKGGWIQLAVFAASAIIQLFVVAVANALIRALEVERQRSATLADEMLHRALNILALVQSIARQTFGAGDAADNKAAFEKRLEALARSHKQLRLFGYEKVEFGPLLEAVVQPFDKARIELSGPRCFIDGSQCASIAMLIHELATNAVKYGALSGSEGTVAVAWSFIGDDLTLTWRETGGPAVEEPRRRGLGSRLIKSLFPGEENISFGKDGVVASFRIRAAAMQ